MVYRALWRWKRDVAAWKVALSLLKRLKKSTFTQAANKHLCGKTYLPQWANETHEAYQDRLATSTLLPVLKETIGQMVGRVFYKDLDTSQVFGSLKDFLPNIDLQKN